MKIEIDDELIVEGIARGVERAIGGGVRAEFRAFLEEYFGCLTKAETQAFLGVSERTVEELWNNFTIPKDTRLGDRMPRTWLPALKEVLAAGRVLARETKAAPKLRVVKDKAA